MWDTGPGNNGAANEPILYTSKGGKVDTEARVGKKIFPQHIVHKHSRSKTGRSCVKDSLRLEGDVVEGGEREYLGSMIWGVGGGTIINIPETANDHR